MRGIYKERVRSSEMLTPRRIDKRGPGAPKWHRSQVIRAQEHKNTRAQVTSWESGVESQYKAVVLAPLEIPTVGTVAFSDLFLTGRK